MHLYQTAFIGLFLIGIAVSQDAFEAAYLNSRLYNQGDIPDVYGETPYWWMNRGSPFKRSFQPSGSGCGPECQSSSGTLQVNGNEYSNNPFLNGNSISSDTSYSNNPFLNSGKPFATKADSSSSASNDFGSGPYSYMAPGYLPPQDVQTISCNGQGKVCVTKYLCNNGFVDSSKVQGSSQNCNTQNEVCCTILVPTPPPTPPPRPTTPYQPQPQSTPCVDQNYGCVSPDQCVNGVVARTPNRPSSQKCFAPEVCCRYQDQFPSQNQVTNDVRPTPRPTPAVTPGEVLTSEGYVITVPKTKFPPPPPTTQRPYVPPQTQSPYVSIPQTTQRPYVPPQTQRPYVPPQTQRPYVPPQTQRPYVPPQTQRPYVPPQTQRPYVPPQTTQRPYVPPQTQRPYVPPQTQRPYVPPQTQRPYVPPQTQRPYVPPQPTQVPFKGEEYIPPKDNHIGEPSNDNPYTNYLPPNKPERGEEEKSEPIENPSNVNQNVIRPNRPTVPSVPNEVPIEPPTQCPAATNCTEIQYCTAEGSISKTIVTLSQDQEIYRVPLSDCRSVEKGFIGKCCRDPDYVDPWPVGILGQYNASILGFDDGSYKPGTSGNGKQDRRNGNRAPFRPNDINNIPSGSNQGPVAVRGQAQLSLPIPQTSQTQNTYTRTPYPQANQPNQIFGRDKSPVNPIEPVASGSNVCAIRDVNSVPKGNGPFDAAFGEFPWQAMILKESTKTLLCGGAIVAPDTVMTAAHCVDGVQAFDILIKGGEWKLGSDEEPKPFQSIRVKSISVHPEYQTTYGRDIALLHLERPLKFDKHIGAICLDDREPTPNDNCVCTGWGKEALKYHAANALMHSIPINPLAQSECQASVGGHNPQTACCGRPQADACQLDAGSALACDNGNGKYTLKGIYSAETECASPSSIVTFAKMDVPWIKNTMGSPSQPQRQNTPQTIPQPNYRPTYQSQQPSTSQLAYSQSTQAPSYLPPRQ